MAGAKTPKQNSITTRDTLISTIYARGVLLGAYVLKHQKPFDPEYLKKHGKTA
jgi:hypothetical protein